jgi:Skp family chaperone for outer membrane proteins
MPRPQTLLLLVLVAAAAVGCQPSAPSTSASQTPPTARAKPRSTVGTIDMQRIFVLMGLDRQVENKRRGLGEAIGKLQKQLSETISQKLEEFGGDVNQLTDSQRNELDELDLARRQQLREKESQAQQQMSETTRWVQRALSQKTKEPIERVADKRGLDVVLFDRAGAFAFSRPALDITDEVIQLAGIGMGKPAEPQGAGVSDEQPGPAEQEQPKAGSEAAAAGSAAGQ